MKTLFLSIILFSLVTFTTQACTDPTKPSSSSGVCEACPNSTPFWDPYGIQCVTSCPVIAPKYDSNLWCQTCPSTTPYWDTNTLTCTTCPSGYFNLYTQTCGSSCPTYAPNWNSTNKPGSCVKCTTSSPYWFDNTTNISAANTQGLATCMSKCQFPWPHPDTNKFCEACPANIQYWDETSGQCLASCPNARPDPGTNNYCSACPVLSPHWNSVNQACEPCPTATPYFDNTTFTCVARCADSTAATPSYDTDSWCQNCSISSFVYYWDNADSVCTSICPRPTPTNNSLSWCKSCSVVDATKPYWNSQSYSCTDVCPTNMPSTDSDKYCVACAIATPLWSTTNSMCEACPAGKHYDSQTSQTAPYGSCLDPCPVTRPFANSDNWCVSCSGTDIYWDSYVSTACVATCPRSTPATDSNSWCQSCPAGSIYWDSTTSTCVPSCPDARPIVGADNWCEACPLASHWDPATSLCVTSCPSTTPLVNSDNVCVACTGSTPIWNPLIPTCVSSCQGAAHFPSGGICQSCPVNNPNWDATTSTCVTTCPVTRPRVDSNHRCQPCTSGTQWNPLTSTCVATCPQTNPFVDSNNWCQPCPSATPQWNSLTSTCVANCPPAKPITGAYNWCQACPAGSPYWNPTISACVPSCQPPLPVVGANNWCQACPTATPYWYAGTPACVATCPRTAPAVDGNNQCQSCPSATPYWDYVTTKCYNICPAPRPVIGADAWCEECPSATPYYNGLTNVCVNTCPPQTPDVNSNSWCQACTGALLKWDPSISSCVASCPKELPFFNKNSVPPACEMGPPVQSIVDYLQTSGVVMPATLAGMQLAMPGLPYVAVTILLIGLLKYVRYININFPEKIAKVFQEGTLNVPSLNFGPMFPEDWKHSTYGHPAPFRFAQYDINGLFVANFWRGISTALIITAGVALLQLFLKKKVKNEKVVQVREKAKNFLLWNYVFSFYISNIGNLAMYIFIEYQSLYLQDSLGTGSFLVNMIFSQLSVFGLIYMVRRIKRFHKLKTQAVKKQQRLPMDESIKVLLEKFKDEHLMQMLVIPILCARAALDAIIIAAVNNPMVQCSLLVAMNFIMIAYYIKYRPHRAIVDNIQLTAFEVTLLVVNLTCLHLSTLSSEEQIASEGAGSLLVACNVIMFVLSFLFVFTKVILAIIKAIFDKFRLKRPSNSVYVQTDISSTVEMTPTSAKYAKLETQAEDLSPEAKNNRLPSINFVGSVSMDVGTEGDQSPSPAAVSRNFNSNNIRRPFHVVRIPEGEDESMHLSKYVDKRS